MILLSITMTARKLYNIICVLRFQTWCFLIARYIGIYSAVCSAIPCAVYRFFPLKGIRILLKQPIFSWRAWRITKQTITFISLKTAERQTRKQNKVCKCTEHSTLFCTGGIGRFWPTCAASWNHGIGSRKVNSSPQLLRSDILHYLVCIGILCIL